MAYLIHFNPYHDPKNGKFTFKKGGMFIDNGYDKKRKIRNPFSLNDINNKRHFDTTLKADRTELQTLSFDPNRTKDTDMFYASTNGLDSATYKAVLNRPAPKDITDEKGNVIGTGMMYKKAIINNINKDIKVASEDNAARVFSELYNTDRDFFNFVSDKNRMRSCLDEKWYKVKGYRETSKLMDKMDKNPKYIPNRNDMQVIYRMFNYVIPYYDDGKNSQRVKDVRTQRAKFFDALMNEGYGACLDTNDGIYNGVKASNPVIIFDMESVVPKEVRDTNVNDNRIGTAALFFRKTMGI